MTFIVAEASHILTHVYYLGILVFCNKLRSFWCFSTAALTVCLYKTWCIFRSAWHIRQVWVDVVFKHSTDVKAVHWSIWQYEKCAQAYNILEHIKNVLYLMNLAWPWVNGTIFWCLNCVSSKLNSSSSFEQIIYTLSTTTKPDWTLT